MAPRALHQDLLHVSKSPMRTLSAYKAGVSLEQRTGFPIDQLREMACRDRYRFARAQLSMARQLLRSATPEHRLALGRGYYAMYHAVRALVFFTTGGDDHEAHSELPGHLPKDFTNRDVWENELKNARLERNKADYDPYPKGDRLFQKAALDVVNKAEKLLPLAKRYLAKRGCKV